MTRFATHVAVAVVMLFAAVSLSGCEKKKKKETSKTKKPNRATPKSTPKKTPVTIRTSPDADAWSIFVTSGGEQLKKDSKFAKSYKAGIEVNSAGSESRLKGFEEIGDFWVFAHYRVTDDLKEGMTALFANEAAKVVGDFKKWGTGLAKMLRTLTFDGLNKIMTTGVWDKWRTKLTSEGYTELVVRRAFNVFCTRVMKDLHGKEYVAFQKELKEVFKNKRQEFLRKDATWSLQGKFYQLLQAEDEAKRTEAVLKAHKDIVNNKHLSNFNILDTSFAYIQKKQLTDMVGTKKPTTYTANAESVGKGGWIVHHDFTKDLDDGVTDEAKKAQAAFAVLFTDGKGKCAAFIGINSDSKHDTDSKEKAGLVKQVRNVTEFATAKKCKEGAAFVMGDFGVLAAQTLENCVNQTVKDKEMKKAMNKAVDSSKEFYKELRHNIAAKKSPRTQCNSDKEFSDDPEYTLYNDYEDFLDQEVAMDGTKRTKAKKWKCTSDKLGVMVLPIDADLYEEVKAVVTWRDEDSKKRPLMKTKITLKKSKGKTR